MISRRTICCWIFIENTTFKTPFDNLVHYDDLIDDEQTLWIAIWEHLEKERSIHIVLHIIRGAILTHVSEIQIFDFNGNRGLKY